MTGQDGQATSASGGFALGVDLGTSNTVAVLRWPDGRTRPLLFDGQPIMPSGVFLDQAGRPHVGRDAQRLSQADPARYEPNPKRRVDEPAVLLGDREIPTADLLGAVLTAVARAAIEAVGFLPPAAVTYPAGWGARRRQVLADAIVRAGWPPAAPTPQAAPTPPDAPAAAAGQGAPGGSESDPTVPIGPRAPGGGTLLLPEPVAAARYFTDVLRRPVPVGAALTVFDFGGGTLDIAVVRNEGAGGDGRARFAVLGSGGVAELGGLDLDAALVEHLGRLLASSAPLEWEQLSQPRTPTQWRARRQFWDDVRGAKEMLSRSASAPVPVPGVDQAVHLTREELERLAGPLLRRGVFEAARVLTDSGVRPDQLAGLFLVGGSSRVPLVARMLHAELGIAPTVLEQPELPVAEGALTELLPVPGSASLGAPPSGPQPFPAGGVPTSGAPISGAPTTGTPAGGAPVAPMPAGRPVPGFGPAGPAAPGFGASGPPAPYPAKAFGRLRRRTAWIAAAAALAVVATVGGVALYLNRGPQELDFVDVSRIGAIDVGEPVPYHTFTDLAGGDGYVAWQTDDRLRVAAVDAETGEQRWRHEMSGRSAQWAGIGAYPDVLLVYGDTPSSADPRPLFALDPATGREMWRREVHGDDRVYGYDSVILLVDNQADRLVGLDPRTGAQKWEKGNPKSEYGYTDAAVFPALTEDDVAGPANPRGVAFTPVPDDDYRIVQIGSDRRARVLDVRSGKVTAERGNVGEPGANYLAYGGRLFVAGTGGGYQIAAYDLDGMGEPRSVYRAADGERSLREMEPCGPDRICVRDDRGSDTEEVAAVNAADGGQLWRRPAPKADDLVGVGERVLIQFTGGDDRWTLRDGAGEELLSRPGRAVRVDAANLLSFTGSFSTSSSDLSVAGVGALSGAATELGPLTEARGESCSWNTSVVLCMMADDFALWRFADN